MMLAAALPSGGFTQPRQVAPAGYREAACSYTIAGSTNEFAWDITTRPDPDWGPVHLFDLNRDFRIAVERGTVVNPKVLAEGIPDVSSLPALADSLLEPGMSDRAKAWALFQWVSRSHYGVSPPFGWDRKLPDMVAELNSYGMYLCSGFSNLLVPLMTIAGIPGRRVSIGNGIGSHSISEFFYDGGWHLLDATFENYCLDDDLAEAAGIAKLASHSDLFLRGKMLQPTVRPLFESGGEQLHADMLASSTGEFPPEVKTGHCMDISLVPGQTYTRSWLNEWAADHKRSPTWPVQRYERQCAVWPFYSTQSTRELFGEATLDETLDFSDPAARGRITEIGKLMTRRAFPFLCPAAAGQPAGIVYRLSIPYAILAVDVGFAGLRKAGNAITVECSTDDGRTWQAVQSSIGAGSFHADMRLAGEVGGYYGVWLRVTMRAADLPEDVGLNTLRVRVIAIANNKVLPRLNPGTTRVTYSDASGPDRAARLVYTVVEETPIKFAPNYPVRGETVTIAGRVRNAGNAPAENVRVRFFDADPREQHPPPPIAEDRVIPRIAPGENREVSVVWDTRYKYGLYKICMVVNPAEKLAETDFESRLASKFIAVDWGPDVAVFADHMRITEGKNGAGEVQAAVFNLGDRDASDVRVQFFAGDPDAGGRPLGESQRLKVLKPRLSRRFSAPLAASLCADTNLIFARVACQAYQAGSPKAEIVRELAQANNTASQRFQRREGRFVAWEDPAIRKRIEATADDSPMSRDENTLFAARFEGEGLAADLNAFGETNNLNMAGRKIEGRYGHGALWGVRYAVGKKFPMDQGMVEFWWKPIGVNSDLYLSHTPNQFASALFGITPAFRGPVVELLYHPSPGNGLIFEAHPDGAAGRCLVNDDATQFARGRWHRLRMAWSFVEPGAAPVRLVLWVDGKKRDERRYKGSSPTTLRERNYLVFGNQSVVDDIKISKVAHWE